MMAEGLEQGAKVFFGRDMDRGEIHPLCGGLASVYSARCPGKERLNEDAAALIAAGASSAVLVVADGLGGGPSGQQASSLAVRTLVDSIAHGMREDAMLRTAILNGLEAANRAVQQMGIGAATTVAVVELQEGTVRPYHVGDSMILVVGQRGKIKLQTTSHSPVGFAVEAGLLDEQEAMFHHDRHVVSNVVGCPKMKIELGPALRLAPRDTVLLASDGLFDNLHVEEIVERMRKGSLESATLRLLHDSRRRMNTPEENQPSKPDDLTFVLFRPQPAIAQTRGIPGSVG
jgi:serine/threonine protein phosphatase PrpC